MKVELHLHTQRYSGCSTATPSELMGRLVEAGYEAAYITEHDAVWSQWEIDQLQVGFPELRIFPGVELTVGEPMKHIVVLGTTDVSFLDLGQPRDILDKARQEGCLTVLAHPARWEGGPEMLEAGFVPDALEFRTNNHSAEHGRLVQELAQRYDLPLVNAGDVHNVRMANRYWIETDAPLVGPLDIREVVLAGEYRNQMAEGAE